MAVSCCATACRCHGAYSAASRQPQEGTSALGRHMVQQLRCLCRIIRRSASARFDPSFVSQALPKMSSRSDWPSYWRVVASLRQTTRLVWVSWPEAVWLGCCGSPDAGDVRERIPIPVARPPRIRCDRNAGIPVCCRACASARMRGRGRFGRSARRVGRIASTGAQR